MKGGKSKEAATDDHAATEVAKTQDQGIRRKRRWLISQSRSRRLCGAGEGGMTSAATTSTMVRVERTPQTIFVYILCSW